MLGRNHSSLVLMCGLLLALGCSDDDTAPGSDLAVDAGMKDGAVKEAAVPDSATLDLPTKDAGKPDVAKVDMATADTGTPDYALPDAMPPDTKPTPDSKPLTPDAGFVSPGVVYASGTSTSSRNVNRIGTSGSGKTTVTGLPKNFNLYYSYLVGRKEYAYVNRHRPMPMPHISTYHRPLHLPNNLGHLYTYYSSTPPGRGFFMVRPSGKAEVIAFKGPSSGTSTSYSYNYYYYIGANKLGNIIAAAYAYGQSTAAAVHLIRTDGKKWAATGNYVCDISPKTSALRYIYYHSFRFANKYFYFVAKDATSTSNYHLFKAPQDCSAKATKVTLPTVGGSAPTYFDTNLGLSEDGSRLFFVAGTSSSKEDIMVLNDATGSARNVSQSPAAYYGPSTYELYYSYSSSPAVDLSPNGKYVAYVKAASPYPLYVRPADASTAAVAVKTSTDFASTAKYTSNVRWLNNDMLMFWVGSTSSYSDMFIYRVSTGKVTQATSSGSTAKPYTGASKIRAYGGWVSPNGKYFHYTEYQSGTPTQSNIRSIDRTTGKIIDVTKGLYAYYGSSNIEAAAKGSKVFFYAYKAGASPKVEDVYYFDQNAPKTATKLTSHSVLGTSTSFYIYDLVPSNDGSKVAYTGNSSSKAVVFVTEALGTPKTYQLSATPTSTTYTSDLKLFTPDGKSLVYGLGNSTSKLDLRIQTIGTGTKAKILESTTGYTAPMMVYK